MSFEAKTTQNLITSSTANMSGTLTSSSGNVTNASGYSVQATWTAGATPVGATKLQSSDDNSNWVDISNSSQNVSGNTGSNMWDIGDVYYNFVRLVYTPASGDGTLNVILVSKG